MSITPRDDVALMAGYHSPQVDVAVRLNTNESPYPAPAAWRARLHDALDAIEWHRYPDRDALDLRRAIGALHGVGPELIFVANGSNEVLQTILLTYGGPGRRALVWEPTYALHSHIARITSTEVITGERGPDFSLTFADAAKLVRHSQPDITFLCSPNNPTGMVDDEDLVAGLMYEPSGLLVIDEAYGQFAPKSHVDAVVSGELAGSVVTRTFSKTWSMAAARLGYCVAAPEVVEQLYKVVLPYHLDAFKQVAATLALDYVDEMNARVASLVEERGRLQAALTELPVDVFPSGANFILFRPTAVDGAEVWQQLLDRSVLVRDCSSWPRLEGCLRVTIGTTDEDDAFLTALQEILT